MLRDGHSAMRVDEVIRSAGLSKGSFYHFFDSKEALGLAALEHYYADRVGRLAAGDHGRRGRRLGGRSDPFRHAEASVAGPAAARPRGPRGKPQDAVRPTGHHGSSLSGQAIDREVARRSPAPRRF